jgi:ribosome biogenesis GTPase / thiamine phosphate phosphatase
LRHETRFAEPGDASIRTMSDFKLEDFGWNAVHAADFKALVAGRFRPARVAIEHRGGYQVVEPDLGLVPASITGRLRHDLRDNSKRPVVGDWVAMTQPQGEKKAVIHQVLPRRTRLSRNAAGRETEEQILAANIDQVLVAASLALELNIRRIERYVAVAADSGARVVLLLTKADLAKDPAAELAKLQAVLGDVPVLTISSVSRKGLKDVRKLLKRGETSVIIGPSGVGKSSLINTLCDDDELLLVQEARGDDQKGRHTTTHRELLPLPNGALMIDTPGVRELQVWIDEAELAEVFAEIEQRALRCKFTTCRHVDEIGCAIRPEVVAGRIPEARLTHYRQLKEEAAQNAERQRQRRLVEEHRVKKRLINEADGV